MNSPRKTLARLRVCLGTGAGVCALALGILSVPAAHGAIPQAGSTDSASRAVADGWRALAAGDLAAAERAAAQAMRDSGGSIGAVTLAIEVDIATARQAVAGLDTYERWLGGRRVEAPYLLRRVAQAHLRHVVGQAQHPWRLEAARLLAADGDPGLTEAVTAAANGAPADPALLAAAGDERAVKTLIAQLQDAGPGKLRIIDALARTGSPLAVPPLTNLLQDPRVEHRGAAAEALGRLGATDAAPRLRPLLDDTAFPVRLSAAAALYRLDDMSGVQVLEQLLSSEHPAVRLSAAEALSARPGGAWLQVARALASEQDETVRLGAARLLATHDPVLAAQALHSLGRSENPAVREEAERALIGDVSADFAGLRRALRGPDGLTAVRAAGRILGLTR
jgi:HEAT repeat protein